MKECEVVECVRGEGVASACACVCVCVCVRVCVCVCVGGVSMQGALHVHTFCVFCARSETLC